PLAGLIHRRLAYLRPQWLSIHRLRKLKRNCLSHNLHMPHTSPYDSLCNHAREAAKLASIMGLLEWDERTKMPPAGGEYRAEQISYLAGEIHKKQTAPQVGEWLAAL